MAKEIKEVRLRNSVQVTHHPTHGSKAYFLNQNIPGAILTGEKEVLQAKQEEEAEGEETFQVWASMRKI